MRGRIVMWAVWAGALLGGGAWAQGPEEATLEVEGLHVRTFGDPAAPAVVFLHGGPGYNAVSFELAVGPALAEAGLYAVSYDRRGCGRSAAAEGPEAFDMAHAGEDLAAVLEAVGVESPWLIGHSFGGAVALRFDAAHPGRAAGIVLVGAPVRYRELFAQLHRRSLAAYDRQETPRAAAARAHLVALHRLMYDDPEREAETFTPLEIGASFQHAMGAGVYSVEEPSEEAVARVEAWREDPLWRWVSDSRFEPVVGFAQSEAYGTADLTALVRAQEGRVHGIYGAEDGLFDGLELACVAQDVGEARFHRVEGASHAVFADQPARFVELVVEISEGSPGSR